MEKNRTDKVTTALFALLRAGLWRREDDWSAFPLSDAEWQRLHTLACEQTVCAIVFSGVNMLPEDLLPNDELMMEWVIKVDDIEKSNREMNAALCKMSQCFQTVNARPMLLKGQGVAEFYPNPLERECGDVDLYFPDTVEEERFIHYFESNESNMVSISNLPNHELTYNYAGVVVEHHVRLLDMHDPFRSKILKNWILRQNCEAPSFCQDGKELHLCIPSPMANLLMLSCHILKHVVGRGIGLRQICDMAMAYHSFKGKFDGSEMVRIYSKAGMKKWTGQLHAFLVEFLGVDKAMLPGVTDSSLNPELLRIIIDGGNFGRNVKKSTDGHSSQMKHKLATLETFWDHRKFSMRYAPCETLWLIARQFFGNLWK